MPNAHKKGKRQFSMWLSEEERATLEDMAKRAGYDTITAFLKAAIAADAVNNNSNNGEEK